MEAPQANRRISLALARLDALAERDTQPRYVMRPERADPYWGFSDGHLLFRFPASLEPGVDMSRWMPVDHRGHVLQGADRVSARRTLPGAEWRSLVGTLADADASRWPEGGLDLTTFEYHPGPDDARCACSFNSRLLRVALMPAAAHELVVFDVAGGEPLWLHGDCWSAAVAPLRQPIPRTHQDRRILI